MLVVCGQLRRNLAWALLCIASVTLYIVLPGPVRSPFSGTPLSSKATVLFTLMCVLSVFVTMFHPFRSPNVLWPALLLVLAGLKVVLSLTLIPMGWRGEYNLGKRASVAPAVYLALQRVWFHSRGPAALPYRIDQSIDFENRFFGLSFLNEFPLPDWSTDERANVQRLLVRWIAWTYASRPHAMMMTISAAGRARMWLDDRLLFDAQRPWSAAVNAQVSAGLHKIVIIYEKPPGVLPIAHVLTAEPLTAVPAAPAALQRSHDSSRLINALGLLAVLILVAALVDAYRPLPRLFMHDFWVRPDRLVAVAFAALFLLAGLRLTIPTRHLTTELSVGNDPLGYESDARVIARNGLLLVDDAGYASAYFSYPLYPYALALAHIIFGDDLSTVTLFNYYCIAASLLLVWALLRGRLSDASLCFVLLMTALFAVAHLRVYAETAFTDNLFLPLVLGMLCASIIAFERRSIRWMLATGFLTAVGAAARPTLMIHFAFLVIVIVFYRDFGKLQRRILAVAALGIGFGTGIAPFTIRNWIVSKKFVLLVSSSGALTHFLWGPEDVQQSFLIDGRIPTMFEAVRQFIAIYSSRPLHFTCVEMRKVLFTLGLTAFGPAGDRAPLYFFVFSLLFALALWLRRVPPAIAVALLTFAASHIVAMILGVPWTYGYKTILPFVMACILGSAFLLRRMPESQFRPAADGRVSESADHPHRARGL